MSSLKKALLERPGPAGLIAYLTLGDPDRQGSMNAARELAHAGVTALELGLPTRAATENAALTRSHARASAKLDEAQALELAHELACELPCPLVLVSYWPALVDEAALERFVDEAKRAGAAATLVVGLPFGALSRYAERSRAVGLETVLTVRSDMVAPMRRVIYRATTGCLYLVAREGAITDFIARVRSETDLPLIVGGGLTGAAEIADVTAAGARAAAVGAAVAERLERGLALAPWAKELMGR